MGVAALALTSLLTSVLLVLALVGALQWWSGEIGLIALIGIWAVYLLCYRAANWMSVGVALAALALGLAFFYPAMTATPVAGALVSALPVFTLAATWDGRDRGPRCSLPPAPRSAQTSTPPPTSP